ncbi:hypothetical protein VPH35_138325 [Triticum aestivum]
MVMKVSAGDDPRAVHKGLFSSSFWILDVQCCRIPRAVRPAPSCGSSTATGDSLPSLTSLHNRRAALLSLMGARLTGLLLVRPTTTSHPDDNYLCFETPRLELSLGVCGAVQPQWTCSSVLV